MDQATDETYQGLSHQDLVFRCQRTRSLVIKGAMAVVDGDLGSGRAAEAVAALALNESSPTNLQLTLDG